MSSSRWQAQGNVYLVSEEPLTADLVRLQVGDADGILEVRDRGADWIDIVIWNPDGSCAEMSGNGTRIAARWLAELTGAELVTVRVGPRAVSAKLLPGGLVEQDLGPVHVGVPEQVDGIRLTAVDVGNPHAVVDGDPGEIVRIGPQLETHTRFPNRTNVQVARRVDAGTIEARVWERGVGETGSSGTSAVAVAAAFGAADTTVRFPSGPLEVRFVGGRALLTGPAERVSASGERQVALPSPGMAFLIEFPADDADRGRRFWERLLGLELESRTGDQGRGWQADFGAVTLGVHERGTGPGDRFSLPYFTVPDLAAALEDVTALGGEIVHPGERWAICRDSEGTPFGLGASVAPG